MRLEVPFKNFFLIIKKIIKKEEKRKEIGNPTVFITIYAEKPFSLEPNLPIDCCIFWFIVRI